MSYPPEVARYDAAPGMPVPPANQKMNPLAVAALIFGLTGCLSIAGVFMGVTALRQIKQDGGRGKPLAITGIVLGALVNGTAAILIIISFAVGH